MADGSDHISLLAQWRSVRVGACKGKGKRVAAKRVAACAFGTVRPSCGTMAAPRGTLMHTRRPPNMRSPISPMLGSTGRRGLPLSSC